MPKILIACIAGLFFFAGCVQDMELLEKGNRDAEKKVLIAGTQSEFKQKVIEKVMEKLGSKDYYFKIIGLDRLKAEETGPYGAIILVNAFMAGQLDGRVKEFLQQDPTNPKAIVFYTIGDENSTPPDWAKPDIRVDAVTSASILERVGQRADELVAIIKNKF